MVKPFSKSGTAAEQGCRRRRTLLAALERAGSLQVLCADLTWPAPE